MRVTWKRKTKEYKARREIRIIRLNIQFGVWVLVAVIYDKHNPQKVDWLGPRAGDGCNMERRNNIHKGSCDILGEHEDKNILRKELRPNSCVSVDNT